MGEEKKETRARKVEAGCSKSAATATGTGGRGSSGRDERDDAYRFAEHVCVAGSAAVLFVASERASERAGERADERTTLPLSRRIAHTVGAKNRKILKNLSPAAYIARHVTVNDDASLTLRNSGRCWEG